MNYYAKRILSAFITLLLVITATFFMMRAIPGGPFTRERALPPEIEASLNRKYNLDAPLLEQYFDYMGNLFQLDFGPSFRRIGYSVNEIIAAGLPASATIGLFATVLVVIIGIPIGIVSALKQDKPVDYLVMFLATLGVTVPSFIIATLYVYVFGAVLGWAPTSGLNTPIAYIGPVLCLSGYSLSFVTRLMRSSMLEVSQADYIRTARANGLSERRVIFKHALKNALIPVITYIGPMFAAVLTGSFVIENVFAIPGIGENFVNGVASRDYTLIIGVTVVYAAVYIIMVLLVDLAYSLIDPRIKLDKKAV